jgi:alpha-ribazole phosphatase
VRTDLTLYLVRHLAPLVAPGICYGRTDLDAVAGSVAGLPSGVPVYSSPLRRCLALARTLGDTVIIDQRLAELDFGSWEMRRWDEIGRAEIDAWAADVVRYRPGGTESVFDMAGRVKGFYDDLPPGPAIVICHAGTIRLLTACARGLDAAAMAEEAAARPHAIGYGEVVLMRGV